MDICNPDPSTSSTNVLKEWNVGMNWKPRSPATPCYRVSFLAHIFVLITKEISEKEENKSLRIWSSPEQDHNGQFAEMGFSNFPLWWWWGYEILIIAQELPSLEAAKKTPTIIEGRGLRGDSDNGVEAPPLLTQLYLHILLKTTHWGSIAPADVIGHSMQPLEVGQL